MYPIVPDARSDDLSSPRRYVRYGDGQRNNGGIDRAQPTICACCVSRRFLMRGPTRGSRDGKVGCAKRSSGGKNSSFSYPYRFTLPSLFVKIPFALKKSTRNSGEGSQAVQGGGGKKRHRIDETRQVTNNNLGRGEREPPLFLPFVSKISRTMDAPPPPPPGESAVPPPDVRVPRDQWISRPWNKRRNGGTKGGREGAKNGSRSVEVDRARLARCRCGRAFRLSLSLPARAPVKNNENSGRAPQTD